MQNNSNLHELEKEKDLELAQLFVFKQKANNVVSCY